MRIVHQGRGDYLELDGARYPIEHVEGRRFAIHFPAGYRHGELAAHRDALEALAASEPAKWTLEESLAALTSRAQVVRPRSTP